MSHRRGGDPLFELLLRPGADLARGFLAVLEHHQGRDRHDSIFRCGSRVLVHVELDDLDLAAKRAGDLLERRCDHLAWAAPFGPEIDHHRACGLEHLGLEICVRNLVNGHGTPRCYSLKTATRRSGRRTYEWLPGPSRRLHAEMRWANAVSSISAGISIRSGASVHTRAARMGLPGKSSASSAR